MKHSCHNREPYKNWLYVQDGWIDGTIRNMKLIPFRMAKDCVWSKEHDDVKCDGCKWKQNT